MRDLSENVKEYIEFTIFGLQYRFRKPNTKESIEIQKTKEDLDLLMAIIAKLTEPVGHDIPFSKQADKMISDHWKNFFKMIEEENKK